MEMEEALSVMTGISNHWVSIKKPLSIYQENRSIKKIAIEISDRAGEGTPYGNDLGDAYQSLGDHKKAIEYFEKQLKIAIEIGDQAREGSVYE